MKKILIVALAAVAVVGCKKKMGTDQQQLPADAIRIGASQVELTKALAPNQFSTGSTIGLSLAVANADKTVNYLVGSVADQTAGKKDQFNFPYTFGTSINDIWNPGDASKLLKWLFATPGNPATTEAGVYLVGYYPYAATTDLNSTTVIPFTLKEDQSLEADLKVCDLMWSLTAGTKVDDKTYVQLLPKAKAADFNDLTYPLVKSKHSSKAVPMTFHHLMSKMEFNVRYTVPATLAVGEVYSKPVLKSVKIAGKEITVAGKLELKDGTFTATANATDVTKAISWLGSAAYVTAGDTPTDIVIKKTGASVDPTDYIKVCELIAQPTTLTVAAGNKLVFNVEYKYVAGTGKAEETRTREYSYTLGSGDFTALAANSFYKTKAAIELSSDVINVTAIVNPWLEVSPNEIQPQ